MRRQHIHVVFRVLAKLCPLRILQQRLQRRQHRGAIELRRRARIIMGERDIGGRARLHRKGDADDFRAHRIDRGGFRIKGDQFCMTELPKPGMESPGIDNQFMLARLAERGIRRCIGGSGRDGCRRCGSDVGGRLARLPGG